MIIMIVFGSWGWVGGKDGGLGVGVVGGGGRGGRGGGGNRLIAVSLFSPMKRKCMYQKYCPFDR